MQTEILSSFFIAISLIGLFYAVNAKRPASLIKPKVLPMVSVMTYAYIDDWAGNVIRRKIENFLKLNYPKDKYEIIVYDNGSTGKTLNICQEYAKKGLIKHYRSDKGYNRKGMVLDDAIRYVAKGDIIALTDPDGICERDWLMKHVCTLMEDGKVGAVAGMIFCGNWYKNLFTRIRAIEDVWLLDVANLGKIGRMKMGDIKYICGANYSFKRKAWKDVGGHGKTLVEDADLANRLQNKGWKIGVTDAGIWQEEVEDLHCFFIQRLRWYGSPTGFILQRKKIISNMLSLVPLTIQFISLFSLIVFALSNTIALRILSLAPFIISFLAISFGLVKLKEERLIPFVPIYLSFDATISLICLVIARAINIMGREVRWVRLSESRYYHNGTRIRVNSRY